MNKEVIFKAEGYGLHRRTTSLYKQLIKALKKEGITTNRLMTMNFKYYNKHSIQKIDGATSFSREFFTKLITEDTVELEITYDSGFLTLTTMLSGCYDDVMGEYIGLWELGLVKRG